MPLRIPPRQDFIGRLLRAPLALLPKNSVVPILSGPLAGQKWVVGSSVHGCWVGTFEPHKQRLIAGMLRPGQVMYDLGANVGLYSLLGAKTVGPDGRVFAFEPVPENVRYLERHLSLNRVSNCTVVQAAVCAQIGSMQFDPSEDRSMGKLSVGGTEAVSAITLDSFYAGDSRTRRPHFLKVDVEGAEVEVLNGGMSLLKEHFPLISLATHTPELDAQCKKLLSSLGYRIREVEPFDLLASRD